MPLVLYSGMTAGYPPKVPGTTSTSQPIYSGYHAPTTSRTPCMRTMVEASSGATLPAVPIPWAEMVALGNFSFTGTGLKFDTFPEINLN